MRHWRSLRCMQKEASFGALLLCRGKFYLGQFLEKRSVVDTVNPWYTEE